MSDFEQEKEQARLIAIQQLKNDTTTATLPKDRINAAIAILETFKEDPKTPSVQINFNMEEMKDVCKGIKTISENTEVFVKSNEKAKAKPANDRKRNEEK